MPSEEETTTIGGEKKNKKASENKRQQEEATPRVAPKHQDERHQEEGGDQKKLETTNDGSPAASKRPDKPRRPRPLRVPAGPHGAGGGPQVGVPLLAQMELGRGSQVGGLQAAAGRGSVSPPKRPAHLPGRLHRSGGLTQTSLGANVSPGGAGGVGGPDRPNRYNWVQMQQWHARHQQQAAAAAAEAAAAASAAAAGQPAPSLDSAGQHQGFHYNFYSPFSSAASRVLYVNPIVNMSNFEHTKSRLIKFIEALKKLSEKWFSHVLLLLFLAVYACLGAYVFISFEAPSEQWEKQQIIDVRLRIVNESYDFAREAEQREQFVDYFRGKFEEYERLLNRVCASGMTSSSLENQWTFWGALFYSMTVFTTIGYGHLTPITFAGRVATMVYAIFGIPILLMVLADLGKLLTRIIKFAFKKFNYIYAKLLSRKAPVRVRTKQLISDNTHQYFGVAREAFERRFGHYLQAYQQQQQPDRLASQFAFAQPEQPSSGRMRILRKAWAKAPPKAARAAQLAAHERDPRLEASDMIVTPPKQTKPVSPQVHADKRHPLEQKHKRAQSPSGLHHSQSSRRKISASVRHATGDSSKRSRAAAASQSGALSGPVSRTTSASNVAEPREKADHPVEKSGQQVEKSSQSASSSSGPKEGDPKVAEAQQEPGKEAASGAGAEQGGQQQELNAGSQNSDYATEEETGADELLEDEDDFDIPVSFALFLLITYMMAGAFVFSIWEGWNFFDALYFVFISMSTIGFGDLVPQHPKRMVGTFAYLLFGLALTSMCINVVQEKIHATFLRAKMQIGEKMGFDLEQIMADDYYAEAGSTTFEEEPPDGAQPETDSLGPSSGSAAGQTVGATALPAYSTGDLTPPQQQADCQTQVQSLSHGSMAKSKSKESLKSPSSQPSSKGRPFGLSRKASTGAKHSRSSKGHAQPASSSSPAGSSKSPAGTSSQQSGGVSGQPIRAQLETVQYLGAPKVEPPGWPWAAGGQPSINQPVIECVRAYCEPIHRSTQQISSGAQPNGSLGPPQGGHLLRSPSETRSLNPSPLSSSKSLDSSASSFFSRNATLRRTAPSEPPGQRTNAASSRTQNGGGPAQALMLADTGARRRARPQNQYASIGRNRSLGSSGRRGSVSDELNQLDDLIVQLSRSPPERFGPLLGIPADKSASERPSRSLSPMANFGPPGDSNHLTSSSTLSPLERSRRATSMVSRSPANATANATTATRDRYHRELSGAQNGHSSFRSLEQNRAPPLKFSQSQSNHQVASGSRSSPASGPGSKLRSMRHHHPADSQQSRKSSSSSASVAPSLSLATSTGSGTTNTTPSNAASPNSRQAPLKRQQKAFELSLSESQAALDELEAVKYSAG